MQDTVQLLANTFQDSSNKVEAHCRKSALGPALSIRYRLAMYEENVL